MMVCCSRSAGGAGAGRSSRNFPCARTLSCLLYRLLDEVWLDDLLAAACGASRSPSRQSCEFLGTGVIEMRGAGELPARGRRGARSLVVQSTASIPACRSGPGGGGRRSSARRWALWPEERCRRNFAYAASRETESRRREKHGPSAPQERIAPTSSSVVDAELFGELEALAAGHPSVSGSAPSPCSRSTEPAETRKRSGPISTGADASRRPRLDPGRALRDLQQAILRQDPCSIPPGSRGRTEGRGPLRRPGRGARGRSSRTEEAFAGRGRPLPPWRRAGHRQEPPRRRG